MSNQHSNTPDHTHLPQDAAADSPVDLSRRKLGAALGVSAVFTLASRPVLATTCVSASAAASGNLSTHGTPPNCTGKSPVAWVGANAGKTQHFHPQTSPTVTTGVFKTGTKANWGNKTLFQVMKATADNGNAAPTPNPISAEFAATLLSIQNGHIPVAVLTDSKLINMWNEWMNTGTFAPKAGVSWNASQIVSYLRTLQGI
ncbi:MAG: hypothetical protein ABL877_09380 [Thiobacillus sp.]